MLDKQRTRLWILVVLRRGRRGNRAVPAVGTTLPVPLTDPALRADLSRRGLERAKAFRWEDTARRTLDVLREVAAG